jgi:ribosomal protein L44E
VLRRGVIRRRKRTVERERARAMRKLVRDREKLARLSAGGSEDRPIHVTSASVVEVRVNRLTCPQCGGEYRLKEHRAPASGLRSVDVTCQICGVSRTLWFRIVSEEAN